MKTSKKSKSELNHRDVNAMSERMFKDKAFMSWYTETDLPLNAILTAYTAWVESRKRKRKKS